MKQAAKILSALLIIFLSQACGLNDLSKHQIKTLDSLGGAVNAATQTLQKNDSTAINKLLKTYQIYAQFINTKLIDTLSKSEAIEISGFFESGESLLAYMSNRTKLLNRLKLINNQTQKLSKDIQNHAIDEEQAEVYFQNEINEAGQVIPIVMNEQKLYYTNVQKLIASTHLVKEIIKQHNQQQLPIIVDTQNN